MSKKQQTKHKLDDVYGVAREVPESYVVRQSVDGKFVGALARDQHIVIYGSSKQGKTCLRKYNLKDEEYISVTCASTWTLGQLHTSILKAAGYSLEGSTVRTTTGDFKVTAKIGGTLGIPIAKLASDASTENTTTNTETTSETPIELDPSDVNDIIAALVYAKSPSFIVLEDFHYLPEATQRAFATALKAFHEASSYSFIVVGVWLDENRLIEHNGDLTGRVLSVNADKWTLEELREVVAAGEGLLNVAFDPSFVDELIEASFDSVWVVQDVCRAACEDSGVVETQDQVKAITADAGELIRRTVDAHGARYRAFLTNFATGFKDTQYRMYEWILYAVLNTTAEKLESGLTLAEINTLINSAHPSAPLNPGNVIQALRFTASLQVSQMQIKPIVLDYDQTYRRLRVVDRSFLIWLQHQERADLFSNIGLPDLA